MLLFGYTAQNLRARPRETALAVVGISLVVLVIACGATLAAAVQNTIRLSGDPHVAVVLSAGSDNEFGSIIEDSVANRVLDKEGISRQGGIAQAVSEFVVVAYRDKAGADGQANVAIRGVDFSKLNLRPKLRIVQGRAARNGTAEVIVGRSIAGRFEGLKLGDVFDLGPNAPVRVVGVFECSGAMYESEVWADRYLLASTYHRVGRTSSMRVWTPDASASAAFVRSVKSDSRLGLRVMSEPEYYERQTAGTSAFVSLLVMFVGAFFALAAVLGAMATMHGSVARRSREIGVMRAIGFSRRTILLTFLLESTMLSLAGGAIGTLMALAMRFVRFSLMNFTSWSEIVFELRPTPSVAVVALATAVAMGVLGGLLPAIRAARMRTVEVLRAQ